MPALTLLVVQKHLRLCLFFISILSPYYSTAQISGRILDATRSNAAQAGLNRGHAVRITAFGLSDAGKYEVVARTWSDASGGYSLNVPEGKPVRMVFEDESNTLQSSALTPAVRFVKSPATEVNWAVYQSEHYISPKSYLASPVYINGSGNDSLSALTALALEDTSVISLATSREVGALWGVAFNRVTGHLYSAALAKRHVGYGPLGTGGIYRTDWRTRRTTNWLDLKKLGIPTGDDHHEGLKRAVDSSNVDGRFMADVGRLSLGGIDVSADGQFLYVMNLSDQTLYGIKLPADTAARPTAADVTRYKIPLSASKAGAVRPFAVKAYRGYVYIGAVYDAFQSQSVADLKAVVYALNPSTKQFREVFTTSLDYPRGTAVEGTDQKTWNPWTDDFSKALQSALPSTASRPQPVLASIAFDQHGVMILGFMDRFGHQSGTGQPDPGGQASYAAVAAGDILRVFPRRPGSKDVKFSLEGNAVAGEFASEGKGNTQGPQGGEFFFQDDFMFRDELRHARVVHEETGAGGVLALPATGEVLMTAHEPTQEFNSGGIKSFFNADGRTSRGWLLYRNAQQGTFGKANGVGGLALITGQPPIAAGNRVWSDTNGDGIQDPEEPALAGVPVDLYEKGAKVATTRTDANGTYLFSEENLTGGLKPATAYEIRIGLDDGKLRPTIAGRSTDKEIDNDATKVGNDAVIAFQTGAAGVHMHDLDFGFLPENVQAGDRVTSGDGKLVVYPNPVAEKATIELTSDNQAGMLKLIDMQGRVMHEQALKKAGRMYKAVVDAKHLQPGSYVLSVEENGACCKVVHIVKQ
ncbi:SdrD B-like domain-containing protein [Dyadobacter sp. 50-39]|uniref:SdrD B-like domain-containing protein n=1 Tax=Dyadobacter sp. 50-39 TaxID=1895756 RepID=UPI000AC06EEC|nr:SdrD B-like domain-containing protein [Dyadobacter sp. 50-39]